MEWRTGKYNSRPDMTRIPIRGIGIVAPGAAGVDAFRELLSAGEPAVSDVTRFDTAGMRAKRAALVSDFQARTYIPVMKMRRMNSLSRFAFAAAKMAIDDCGERPGAGTGLAVGTSFGPVQTSVEYLQEYLEKGPALAPPQLFAESVANAPGSHVAIEWGLRGFNITFTQRESSAIAAAMYAAMQLAKGAAPAALIGGVEEANEMLFSVLDRIGALARAEEGFDEAARPFSPSRNGIALGEGSAFFVAAAGSRDPYGWLAGFGAARDCTAPLSDWGAGAEAVAGAMRGAVEDAGITLDSVDAVYASANGSRRGDALEEAALRLLFGARVPPVVATKHLFGEYAAGGALQIAAALLAVEGQTIPRSIAFEAGGIAEQDARRLPLRHVLVNSVSAGGGVYSAVIARDPA